MNERGRNSKEAEGVNRVAGIAGGMQAVALRLEATRGLTIPFSGGDEGEGGRAGLKDLVVGRLRVRVNICFTVSLPARHFGVHAFALFVLFATLFELYYQAQVSDK